MIVSYRCRDTERLARRESVRRFRAFERPALRKLALLGAATSLEDLRSPPGNRLEALKGDRAGQHSIRINLQWRICFRWEADGVHDVEIVDYHQLKKDVVMTQGKLAPVHPGEILKHEYLEPLGLSATAFAKAIGVPPNRVTRLLAGASAVTADTALRLARALRTSPDMWMNLQSRYELDMAEDSGAPFSTIEPVIA